MLDKPYVTLGRAVSSDDGSNTHFHETYIDAVNWVNTHPDVTHIEWRKGNNEPCPVIGMRTAHEYFG